MTGQNTDAASCRVLVIDDNDGVRSLVRMILQDEPGIELVGEAENGAAGVQQAIEACPDVIILDVNMPVMDGFTALPALRSAVPRASIVVWTAAEHEATTEQRALALGASAFIQKAGREPLAILGFIRDACSTRFADADALTDGVE